jgi:hypothetical protein
MLRFMRLGSLTLASKHTLVDAGQSFALPLPVAILPLGSTVSWCVYV